MPRVQHGAGLFTPRFWFYSSARTPWDTSIDNRLHLCRCCYRTCPVRHTLWMAATIKQKETKNSRTTKDETGTAREASNTGHEEWLPARILNENHGIQEQQYSDELSPTGTPEVEMESAWWPWKNSCSHSDSTECQVLLAYSCCCCSVDPAEHVEWKNDDHVNNVDLRLLRLQFSGRDFLKLAEFYGCQAGDPCCPCHFVMTWTVVLKPML